MRISSRFRIVIMAILFLFVGGSLYAADSKIISVVNNSGSDAADLHAYFSGTGGNVYVDPFAVISPTCPTPAVPTNFTVTDSAAIKWGATCVPAGSSVTFIASTTNGPMILDSICWTDITNSIIDCQTDSITITTFPPPPFGPFGGLKVQIQCRPGPGGFYTLWFPPGVIRPYCWARWCCRPTTDYYYRIVWCPFASRLSRLLELPPWIPITGWKKDGTVGPKYFWIFQTWPPPPDSVIKKGPPPNRVGPGPTGPQAPWAHDLKVRYSDDNGQTFRPGSDFATSFFDIFYEIQLESNTVDTFPTFQSQLMVHSPHYGQAANMLNPLINEVNQVNIFEPNPVLPQIAGSLMQLQNAMFQMAGSFGAGMTGPPNAYQMARDALNNLAMIFATQLSVHSPRYNNAARNLLDMAQGFDASAQAIMMDPPMITNEGMDAFRYGVFNRFFLNLTAAATGTMAHARINVNLGNHVWYPSTIGDVHAITQSSATCEIESMLLPMSDQSSFDITLLNELVKSAGTLRLWFKVPNYLSMQVDFSPTDGMPMGPFNLVAGDVNGDNCVDADDSTDVANDQGLGGPLTSSVPPTDVNADGYVDSTDQNIVNANMGQCGSSFVQLPSCSSPPCCIGLRGSPNGDAAESNILDLTFAVDRIFRGGPPAACFEEGNPNGDLNSLNILDLTYFVDRIFRGGPPPVPCPVR